MNRKIKLTDLVWNSNFCYIIIVFTLILDQLNASFLNNSIAYL